MFDLIWGRWFSLGALSVPVYLKNKTKSNSNQEMSFWGGKSKLSILD